MGKTTNKVTNTASATRAKKSVSGARKIASDGPVATSARSRKADSIAMFIDIDNSFASATNVMESISILRTMGNIVYGKLYGYTEANTAEFQEIVLENKFETAGKLNFKSGNTSVVDTRLLFEAVEFTKKNKFNMVFIWTGIGELSPLFSALKSIGCKTLTVDIPSFDCKNKFVDQAIRLYSPHNFAYKSVPHIDNIVVSPPPSFEVEQPLPPLQPNVEASIAADMPPDLFDNAPILPRKDGAPELGGHMVEKKLSEKEAKQFYAELISNTVKNIESQMDERIKMNEFDDLTDVFTPTRENFNQESESFEQPQEPIKQDPESFEQDPEPVKQVSDSDQELEEEQESPPYEPPAPKMSSYIQDLMEESQKPVEEQPVREADTGDFSDFGNL